MHRASPATHDVFVSYSTPNRAIADAARAAFETAGLSVWMATEAIREGSDWASSIPPAIKSSTLVVLILSRAASASAQVAREVHLAMKMHKRIIPYRVDGAEPSGALEFFLAGIHRIDAPPDEPESRVDDLLERTRRALSESAGGRREATEALPVPTNLPAAGHELVGRDEEVTELSILLGSRRLVTIVGPGGVGKTSVAVEAARAALGSFPGGIWYVELAPIGDPSLIGTEVEGALPQATDAKTLLVLDNCEHVVEQVSQVVAALSAARPHLSILATSREALRLRDEFVFSLAPLALPREASAAPSMAELNASPAARLFLDRAAAAGKIVLTSDSSRRAVAEICRRLDGLPLALELAAARAGALSFEQIARAVDSRFKLLTKGSRDTVAHHQTLRALIDWSFELLGDEERDVLVRLGAFPGRFTLADIAAGVCEGTDEFALLDIVEPLIARSLIVDRGSVAGVKQYDLLESMRAYLRHRLDEKGEYPQLAAKVARRGAEEAAAVSNDEQRTQHFAASLDNIRFALEWYAAESGDADAAAEIVVALNDVWIESGRWLEGRHWTDTLLGRSDAVSRAMRLPLLMTAAAIAGWMEDYSTQIARLTEALTYEADDRKTKARILNGLAVARYHLGEFDRAFDLWTESAGYLDGEGLAVRSATVANNLALIELLVRRDYDSASARCAESYRVFAEANHPLHAAISLRLLSDIALARGDVTGARRDAGRSMDLIAPLGNAAYLADAHLRLAKIDLERNAHLSAALHVREALNTYSDELGSEIAECALVAAALLLQNGETESAAELYAAFRAEQAKSRIPLAESDVRTADRLDGLLRNALREDRFAFATLHAQTLTLAALAKRAGAAIDAFIEAALV